MSRNQRPAAIEGVDVFDFTIEGSHGAIPLRRYTPAVASGDSATLLWSHGGGFAFGGLDMPESHAVAGEIARSGRVVYAVDYHRVRMWNIIRKPRPGVLSGIRFPIPVDDVVDAFEFIRKQGQQQIVIGGASAGANLSAAATLRMRDEAQPGPAGLVLAYAIVHGKVPAFGPGQAPTKPPGMNVATIERMTWNYAGSLEARDDPYAFPGGHDLRGFPPTVSLDADRDHIRASGQAFATELANAGVKVDYTILPNSVHGFLNKPNTADYQSALGRITSWLEELDSR